MRHAHGAWLADPALGPWAIHVFDPSSSTCLLLANTHEFEVTEEEKTFINLLVLIREWMGCWGLLG